MSTPVLPTTTTTAVTTQQVTTSTTEQLPSATSLLHASRLALKQDKPILLDYYVESSNGKAFVGEDPETKEKMLVKSHEEFTSVIQKLYKTGDEFIFVTENSIYVVDGKIQKRHVNATKMRSDNE